MQVISIIGPLTGHADRANALSMTQHIADQMKAFAATFEDVLNGLLGAQIEPGERARPANLLAAMRYGSLDGGKRLRPFLLFETAKLFGLPSPAVMRVSAALECVHCYSLIHDDLPAMDNDDLRRGRPTVHRAFDEATAILAGDSLLTLAFDIIAAPITELDATIKIQLVSELARASGIGGMAGGQALDLAAEKKAPDEAGIIMLQAMKTGALIRFAARAGAVSGGATKEDTDRLTQFGEHIGLAFQIADDLLDLTATSQTMGKATGKDAARGKGTLVNLHGETWAQAKLDELESQAVELLKPFGAKANTLCALATYIGQRSN